MRCEVLRMTWRGPGLCFREDLQDTQPEHDHYADFPPQWHLQTPDLAGGKCQHPEIEGDVDDGMGPGHGVDINTTSDMLTTVRCSSLAYLESRELTAVVQENPANVLPHVPEIAHRLTLREVNYHKNAHHRHIKNLGSP